MLVGVIADTHDNVPSVERAVDVFADQGVGTIVHCGDIVAPPVVPFLDGFEVHAVLGNNDGEVLGLHSAFQRLENGSELHGRFAALTIDDRAIAVVHGEDKSEVVGLAAGDRFDYVCYGHHHEIDHRTIDGTTVINPGGHFPTIDREHRCVAIFDTETDDVQFVPIG